LFTILCSNPVLGQSLIGPGPLPDAPIPAGQAAPAAEAQGTAQVAGVVLDARGSAVPGADVALAASGRLGERTATSAADGSFSFTGLPSGEYRLIVAAPGFGAFTSATFTLRPGESATAPRFALTISTTTSVNVFATPDQVATAQVHEEEQQRVFAVFPNFYTSYIWNAAPLPAGQKYKLALRALVDPVQFLTVAGTAGAEQIANTYPGYGSGLQGYGKRYAAGMADATTSRLVGSAILPSLFHQDPRYFYQGTGDGRSRAWHAVNSTFVTRGETARTSLISRTCWAASPQRRSPMPITQLPAAASVSPSKPSASPSPATSPATSSANSSFAGWFHPFPRSRTASIRRRLRARSKTKPHPATRSVAGWG